MRTGFMCPSCSSVGAYSCGQEGEVGMDDEQQAAWMIRTDADCDLTNSLDHCLMTLALAQGDLRNWKWCVTAAYSAAQTAMVMVLDAQGEWKHLKPNHRE